MTNANGSTRLYTYFISLILLIWNLNANAEIKVVVVPMDGNCSTESCGPDLHQPCSAGVGICEEEGVFVCNDNLVGSRCLATPGEPKDRELCNGLDDDCDGATDEDFPDLNALCAAGTGACETLGNFICDPSAPSGSLICSATPGIPSAELCNGIDDDCDGAVDEEIPVPQPCSLQLGVCSGSVSPGCITGQWLTCTDIDYGPGFEPVESSCDFLDNDCDGEIDEGCVDADQDGYYSVASGGFDCDDGNKFIYPGADEICDAIDNDCDAQIDEAGAESSCAGLADQCNAGSCLAGQCEAVPIVGASCNDGEDCTLGEMCSVDGLCTGGVWDVPNCGPL